MLRCVYAVSCMCYGWTRWPGLEWLEEKFWASRNKAFIAIDKRRAGTKDFHTSD